MPMTEPLLSRLVAQDTARRTIEQALVSNRVHHAYLFVGPDGVGKELAAFALAQALVCERRERQGESGEREPELTSGLLFGNSDNQAPAAPNASDGSIAANPSSMRVTRERALACGTCSACVRVLPRPPERTSLHPDVIVLERGLYAPAAIGRRTPETQGISIDQVRSLILARAGFAPHEGRAKVFVIRRVDELSGAAANALLKTLEEPGARTHFVLLSSQPGALLPTILSRTLRVRFAPLPDELVASKLVAQGLESSRAEAIASLAQGSLASAAALADPAQSETRERFVAQALQAVSSAGIEGVLALAESAKKDKDALRMHLGALASAFARDAVSAARGGASHLATGPSAVRTAERGALALRAASHLAANNAPQLVVEAMLLKMRALG